MEKINRRMIALVVIIIICWLDYQYFTEGISVINMDSNLRRKAHIVCFGMIVCVGYWGWYKSAVWLRKTWLTANLSVFILMAVIGFIQWQIYQFSTPFLDRISFIRLFFSSPLPFMLLYLVNKVYHNAVQEG